MILKFKFTVPVGRMFRHGCLSNKLVNGKTVRAAAAEE
jgi:hypothetical protein